MKIGIVGFGTVGSAMARLFSLGTAHSVVVYDKYLDHLSSPGNRRDINLSDLVFLCVPTPSALSDGSCDTSIVDECVEWIQPPICIRSTAVPGTVDRLIAKTGKSIAFSPEYLGEQPGHPWAEEHSCGFLIVGGSPDVCDKVAVAFAAVPGHTIEVHKTSARSNRSAPLPLE